MLPAQLLLPLQLLSVLPAQLLLPLRPSSSPSPPSPSPPSPSPPSPSPPSPPQPPPSPSPSPPTTRSPSPLISTSQINPRSLTLLLPSSRSSVARVLLPFLRFLSSLFHPNVSHPTSIPYFLHILTHFLMSNPAFSSHSHKPPAFYHFYPYTLLLTLISSRFFLHPALHFHSYHSAFYIIYTTTLHIPSLPSDTDYVIRNSPSSLYITLLLSLLNTVTTTHILYPSFHVSMTSPLLAYYLP